MKAKIILFASGLLAVGGGFWVYQSMTGSPVIRDRGDKVEFSEDDLSGGFAFENWSTTVPPELEARMVAKRAYPDPAHKGHYRVEGFRAMINVSPTTRVVIEASNGDLDVQQTITKTKTSFTVKSGNLSGNVTIIVGPRDAVDETNELRTQPMLPGQIRATVVDEKDPKGNVIPGQLKMDWQRRLLSSGNKISIRSGTKSDLAGGVDFDGSDLKMAFNPDSKRVEYLRLEHGHRAEIRPDATGRFNFTAGGTETHPASAPAHASPAEIAATSPASLPTSATLASTRKAREKAPPTTYKITLEDHVKIQQGDRSMASQKLQATMMIGGGGPSNTSMPATAPKIVAGAVATTRPDGLIGDMFDLNNDNGKAEPTVITWTGPMEMRPIEDGDKTLAGNKDFIIDAVGTAEQPVILTEGKRSARAGRFLYQRSDEVITFESGVLGRVVLADDSAENSLGRMDCRKLIVRQRDGRADVIGPGRIEFAASAFGIAADADRPDSKQPVVTTFDQSLSIELASAENPKDPKKRVSYVKQIALTGDVRAAHPTFSLYAGKALEMTLAHVAEKADKNEFKSRQALERLVATGGVEIRNARPTLTVADADQPDSITAEKLELLSKPVPGKSPQIDQMLATNSTGVVKAVMHQLDKDNKDAPGRLISQTLETPRLLVLLEPKEKAATATRAANANSTGGGFDAREIHATGGVKITLDGFGDLATGSSIIATAGELVARPKNAGGTATLTAAKTTPVRLAMGEDLIEGNTVDFNQEARSITIKGAGKFYIVDNSDKAKPVPVRITWQDAMHFDRKTNTARFDGKVDTSIEDNADRTSKLKCNILTVALLTGDQKKTATQPTGAPKEKEKTGLRELIAEGDVEAIGESFEAGKLLTRQTLTSQKVLFSGLTRTLTIPVAGDMTVEDYQLPKKTDPKNPAPLLGGDMRGYSGLKWAGSLVYAGDTGAIEIRKDVTLAHIPLEPFKPAGANEPPTAQKKESIAKLRTETLKIQIEQTKDKTGKINASPWALGESNAVKLTNFAASNGAFLKVDETEMTGNKLTFDPISNAAIADGNVSIVTSSPKTGSNIITAQWAKWDLTKDANAIETKGVIIRGGGQ